MGVGAGGSSVFVDLVGAANGNVGFFLVLEFSFALSFALRFTPPMSFGFSVGDGEREVFALTLGFAL